MLTASALVENSEVLPNESVAVAETNRPGSATGGSVKTNPAFPLPSVVTFVVPR